VYCSQSQTGMCVKAYGTSSKISDANSDDSINLLNPLMGTLQPQSNGPLFSNAVIGTLAVDGWAVTFGTARRGLGGAHPGSSLLM